MAKKTRRKKRRTVIKNYGLMWNRDRIFWGRSGSRGTLLGRRSHRVIDFRDQIGVYVLYDESRRPIYVGQTGSQRNRLFKRLRSHKRDHLADRWRYLSWFGLLGVNENGNLSGRDAKDKRVGGTIGSMLDEIEGVLIAATEPRFNKQGAKFRGIKLYRQAKDEERGDVSLDELGAQIEELDRKIDKLRAS